MNTKTFLSTMVVIFGMMSGVFTFIYLIEHNFFMWQLCVALELAHAWTISLALCYSTEKWEMK